MIECDNPIPQPSAFIRRRVVESIGALDPFYLYFMDWDFWLRAGIQYRIEYFPELFSTYRLHAESNTVSKEAQVTPELSYMYRKYFSTPDLADGIRRQRRKAMANMYFASGGYCHRGGRPGKAVAMALRALRFYPELLARPVMLHKFLYCLFGSSRSYGMARRWLRHSPESG